MQIQEIINGKNIVGFLEKKGFQIEKDYCDADFKEGTYFKMDNRKLLVVYEVLEEDKIKETKDHFLIDRGLSYCIIKYNDKLLFFRSFGENKYFIYSENTKEKISKIDRLKRIDEEGFDFIFQAGKDISGQFYELFRIKRDLVASSITNDYKSTEKYLISQKIFDRFFFIYFLCHKGIIKLDDGREISGKNLFMKLLLKHGNFLDNIKKLFELFNSQENNFFKFGDNTIIVPYLNGGLFRPDILEQDLNIDLDQDTWKEIFDFLNSYHWIIEDVKTEEDNEDKILTPEILGHVYERSVVEWEQKGFKEEAENAIKRITERKKIGVYYTPEPITEYISNSTIIPFLIEKLGGEYTSFEELVNSDNKKSLVDAINILNHIKVLDPACGSGAFLVKASEIIFRLKRRLYYLIEDKKNYYDLKLSIISENIYGVDILAGAIEISKLRLWLWLVSDYQETENQINALPNIEYNLKVGNSVVGWIGEQLHQARVDTPLTEMVEGIFTGLIAFSDAIEREKLIKAKDLLRSYSLYNYIESYYILYKIYRMSHGLKSENLKNILETIRESIYSIINPVYLDYINERTKTRDNKISIEEFSKLQVFHWKIDFGHILKEGFDIIISNPPYIKEYNNRNAFDGVRWSKYYMGKMDIWYLFACKSIDLLNKKYGRLAFIAQNNWTTSSGAKLLRDKIIDNTKLIELLDFGEFKIFQEAGIQTMILILKFNSEEDNYNFDFRKLNYNKEVSFSDVIDLLSKKKNNNVEYLNPIIVRKNLEGKTFNFNESKIDNVLQKISNKKNFSFDEKNEIAQGILCPQDTLNKSNKEALGNNFEIGKGIFVLNEDERNILNLSPNELELLKPYYTTTELTKYYGNKGNKHWIIYTCSEFKGNNLINKYPNIKRHLDQFKNIITSDNGPYGLHRSRNEDFFKGEKIIVTRKCFEPVFTYTNFDCYVSATFFVIKTNRLNLLYLTGLLNSKLVKFWLKNKGKMQGDKYQIDKEPILEIPIKKTNQILEEKVINLVIIILQKKENELDTKEIENELDRLIYGIYDLNESEIEIIEESVRNGY